MPFEIGFPFSLTSGAFVNKKRNKQTSHELQNNLDSSCISFCTSMQVEKDSLKHRHGEQFRTTWRPRMRNALLFGLNFQNAVNKIAKKCMKICLTLLKIVL